MKALLVDDETDRQYTRIMREILEKYEIFTGDEYEILGRVPVEIFKNRLKAIVRPPDIAIIDYSLKWKDMNGDVWNGDRVAIYLRECWREYPCYILFVSAYLQSVERPYEQLLQLLRVPFTGFLEFDYGDTWKGAFEEHIKFACDGVRSARDRVINQVSLDKIATLRARTKSGDGQFDIIGHSTAMLTVLAKVAEVAPASSTVLIQGENGTGKELIARALHANSSRRDKPFVAFNIGSIPKELMEAELFGYVRGAFTGAVNAKKGLFEVANGGTLFLDEIADMEKDTQVKLLRVLQERCFYPLGGVRETKVDVRFVAATNINIEQAVREGRFRQDLYYRICVVPIDIPPLRHRHEDIEELAEHFLAKVSMENGANAEAFSPAALRKLLQNRWPGNVRQLRNAIESAVVRNMSQRIIDAEHIEIRSVDEMSDEICDGSWEAAQDDLWIQRVKSLLTKHHGIVSDVAKELGQHRSHISRKIKAHGLTNFAARLRSTELK